MKTLNQSLLLILLILSVACDNNNPGGYKYNTGSLPETPVNLEDFNTEYDDYNSTAPTIDNLIPFCFSTNRNSQGNDFDVIYQPMSVNFDKTTGELTVSNETSHWGTFKEVYGVINIGVDQIKTSGNEFGPNLIITRDFNDTYFSLLYASDVSGDFQINFISNHSEANFGDPKEVSFLNSEFDDLYPCFNSDNTKIYFCSNREEDNFDFYSVNVDPEIDLETLLSDDTMHEVNKVEALSSTADDKCPFIFGNKMVFASNREGGFGGYDLYYCNYENGKWSQPINFGEGINSEFDEYRPILIDEGVSYTQSMMVFSSNRTGGKGGFDLYFVGIDYEYIHW
ncbi:hypothetical protein DF185_02255 [Marinifilum breve]|uniref:Uncharacterized protein n=1 Tax=Marinifilum breve TaxID=2184082 RepID=A0A2V4A344_9BACT|nr:PD40 domain-containing protein [Marinifilum breve]PXY02938.1 hypothetical protein DF185_02255 [Marinifilum breve]